jgi:hypothetical protein
MIPAFILPLAARFVFSLSRGLRFGALSVLHRVVGGETMDYPRWDAHTLDESQLPRVRRTGISHRVGALWATRLRPFALSRPNTRCSGTVDAYTNARECVARADLAGGASRSGRGYGPLSMPYLSGLPPICLASPFRW